MQVDVGEGLQEEAGHTSCEKGQPTCGNPTVLSTGNKMERVTDFETPGPNRLALVRHYNSLSNLLSMMGIGWSTNFGRSVWQISASERHLITADGQRIVFVLSGGQWLPREGDRFMIPDRDLEDHVFSVSEMTIEVRRFAEGKRIMFNGAVEWALDSIMQQEVIWLPSEAQLRDRLGSAFRTLRREPDGFRCDIAVGNDTLTFTAADPAEAYGAALLALMEDPEGMLRVIVGDD